MKKDNITLISPIEVQSDRMIQLTDNWTFRNRNSDLWMDAIIPGTNFTDLITNKVIEHPFHADYEESVQWIEGEDWQYRCLFEVSEEVLDSDRIELKFDGLDTFCKVFLNKTLILESENMFLGHLIQVKEYLVQGTNELTIEFFSPINRVEESESSIIYPAENDKSEKKHSTYVRKAPYHFGWDWGPRFVTSGVWRPVWLIAHSHAKIADVQSHQHWLEEQVRLSISTEIEAFEATIATIYVSSDKLQYDHKEVINLTTGRNEYTCDVDIINPERWWPNGLGQANLNDFHIELELEGETIDTKDLSIGFRTIEVVNEKDEDGLSFYLKVNGHPVFMKGANYIPSDAFLPNVKEEKYRKVFEDAVSANMNMLRVWGGGIYEDDLFYQLADEYGILIWQDFMFACSLYPPIRFFNGSIEEEVKQNVLRLRNHASLALWCGNNEIEMGIEFWEWPEKFNYSDECYAQLKADYYELFHDEIPKLIKQYDDGRFYFPSSPIGFWERLEDDRKGDNHYWGVWHGEEDFSRYAERIPRFMSEYGFQSFPIHSSIEKFVPTTHQYLGSDALNTHQKHPRGNRIIGNTIENYFKPPKDFRSFVYLSQLVQAEGLQVAFEAHRANMPYCMGSLYWQMNDCWPSISWSSIDYYGKWKALHYQARRSFSKYLVACVNQGGELKTYVTSDDLADRKGDLITKYFSLEGHVIEDTSQSITIYGNQSDLQRSQSLEELPEHVFCVQQKLYVEEKLAYSCNFYPSKLKAIQLPKPEINHKLEADGKMVKVKVSSETFVKSLFIDFKGSEGNFSDNFFDLLPGEEREITYQLVDGEELNELEYFSVYDTSNQA